LKQHGLPVKEGCKRIGLLSRCNEAIIKINHPTMAIGKGFRYQGRKVSDIQNQGSFLTHACRMGFVIPCRFINGIALLIIIVNPNHGKRGYGICRPDDAKTEDHQTGPVEIRVSHMFLSRYTGS